MKLASKITATLGVLFLIVGITGSYSLWQMYNINRIHTEAARDWFPSYLTIQKISVSASSFRRNEVRHVHSSDPAMKKALELSMNHEYGQIASALDEQIQTLPGGEERVWWSSIRDLWTEYQTLHRAMIRLSSDQEIESSLQMLMGGSNQLFNQFSEKLLNTLDRDMNASTLASAQGQQAFSRLAVVLGLLLCGTLLLTLRLGHYLNRGNLRTLGKDPAELQTLARHVAQGQTPERDPGAGGVYADILTMAETLNAHVASLKNTTANIPGGVNTSLLDENGTITYISDGLLAMFGYTRADAPRFQRRFTQLVDDEERARVRLSLEEQLKESDAVELAFRAFHKDGRVLHILERGRRAHDHKGRALLYSVLIDISEQKKTQESLERQSAQCLAALCATNDFVFERTEDGVFILHKGASTWEHTFGPVPPDYITALEQARQLCVPEEQGAFASLFHPDNIAAALDRDVISLRRDQRMRRPGEEEYAWLSCTLICFRKPHGGLGRLYGCLCDINDRKLEERRVRLSAQRDGLTGLYNKGCAEQEINWYLSGPGKDGVHALILIDIDNFKAVNDQLGHLFGDAVLAEVAGVIRSIFRSSDIGGRIGGDEFLVLVKDAGDRNTLENKAEALSQALRRVYAGEDGSHSISGSIGIALYPHDAATYRELFQKADNALYTAKNQGKNRYTFFQAAPDGDAGLPLPVPRRTDIVRHTPRSSFADDVLSYIFGLLYETRDITTIVPVVLGMIGRHYGVSRAYVFQNSQDDLYCSNTFEWCAEGVEPQRDKLQNLAYKDLGSAFDRYTRDGVLYCDDISRLDPGSRSVLSAQNVRAMLHLAIFDDGRFTGYVGFDACGDTRLWTRDEIATLSILAKVLGIFLLKEEFSHRLAESAANTRLALDSLNVWAYVVDQESRELLFVNAKTNSMYPGTRLGDTCHAAFFDRAAPCPVCPLESLRQGTLSDTLEIRNDKLGIWVLTTASYIPWTDHHQAVLISCQDVSRYHEEAAQKPEA